MCELPRESPIGAEMLVRGEGSSWDIKMWQCQRIEGPQAKRLDEITKEASVNKNERKSKNRA